MKPTPGELKIMVDNLDKKLDETRSDIMSTLNEIKSDVKENNIQMSKIGNRVNRHDIWMRAFWWFFGFLGTLIVLSIPLLRYIEKNDIQNSVNQAFDSRFSKIEVVQ